MISTGQNTYSVKVEEVHSGDDLLLLVDLGVDGLYKKVRARLQGVDTPDGYKAGPDTEAGRIRDEVRRLTYTECMIALQSSGRGGWHVVLFFKDRETRAFLNLNDLLKARGYVYTKEAA